MNEEELCDVVVVYLLVGRKILQQEIGHDGGENDWERGGKAFQNVVGIFDDGSDDEAAQRLQHDHRPHDVVVALEEAVLHHCTIVVRVDAEQADDGAEKAQLYVAHPNARGRALEQLLEVDAGKARAKAGEQHGQQADQLAVEVAINWFAAALATTTIRRFGPLNQTNAAHQDEQREPFNWVELFAQHAHAEQSGGENF